MIRYFVNACFAIAFAAFPLVAQDLSTLIQEATQSYRDVRNNILKSAQEMPAESYDYKPSPNSRTFGQLIGEVARSQSHVCSAIEGASFAPYGPYSKSKSDLIQALQESNRNCDAAYAAVSTLNAGQELWFGNMRHSKLGLLFLNANHDNELYGQIAVYLRLNGLIPPSVQFRIMPVGGF